MCSREGGIAEFAVADRAVGELCGGEVSVSEVAIEDGHFVHADFAEIRSDALAVGELAPVEPAVCETPVGEVAGLEHDITKQRLAQSSFVKLAVLKHHLLEGEV